MVLIQFSSARLILFNDVCLVVTELIDQAQHASRALPRITSLNHVDRKHKEGLENKASPRERKV
jgi:hypothetical protein